MKLEKLLNSLIQRGWKPFGEPVSLCVKADTESIDFIKNKGKYHYQYTLRELVGIESRLWQFVCSNNIVEDSDYFVKYNDEEYSGEMSGYKYRLMLSSITVDIEQFLLDNIKLDET